MTDTQLAGALAVLTALGDLYRVSLGLSLAVVIAAFDLAAGVASSLRWLVTSYVITRNVQDQFTNFGASGALVFGLLTWLLLTMLLREKEPEPTPMNIQNAAAALLIILPVAFNLFFFSGEPSTTRTSCAAQPKTS